MCPANSPLQIAPGALLRAAYPASRPTDAFRRRMEALGAAGESMASQAATIHRRMRLVAAAAGVLMIATAAPVAVPRLAEGYELRRIADASVAAPVIHCVTWTIAADGTRTKAWEAWCDGDRFRSTGSQGEVSVYADGVESQYLPSSGLVRRRAVVRSRSEVRRLATPAAGIGFLAKLGFASSFRLAGMTTVGGRRAIQVVYDLVPGKARRIMYVDPASHLPFQISTQQDLGDGSKWRAVTEIDYTRRAPASVFRPQWSTDARFADDADAELVWRARFGREIARGTAGGESVTIRDLQVNARGDVFVLYTDGPPRYAGSKASAAWYLSQVWDGTGANYTATGRALVPAIESCSVIDMDAYTYRGEVLHGAWLLRQQPTARTAQTNYTLTFRRSGADWRPVEQGERTGAPASLAVDVPGPGATCAGVPDYMPYMAIPVSQVAVELEHAVQQGRIYESADRDCARAEAEYLRAEPLATAAHGGNERNPETADIRFRLYCVRSDMGRAGAARQALLRARNSDDGSSPYTHDSIVKALKEEGLR